VIPDERQVKEMEMDEYIFLINDFTSIGNQISSNLSGVDNFLANILYGCPSPGCKNGITIPYKVTQKIEVKENSGVK
jgi:hypothetical protein